MIDPSDLLEAARLLLGEAQDTAPNQARLRRAVSSAYYAVFHAVVQLAADQLVGKEHRARPRYETVYRGFAHQQMKRGCIAVDKETLGSKASKALGVSSVCRELRDVAGAFVALQERRNWADYSPAGKISGAEARDLVDQAAYASAQLIGADPDQRSNFLAYLLLDIRD